MERGSPLRRPPKFVQAFTDRHSKARFYFRRAGSKSVPLPGLPWSPEFMAAYELALTGTARREEVGASRTTPGTINALVVSYYKSAEWNRLTPETQKTRRRIVDRFRLKHGEKRVALLQRDHIFKMLDDIEGVFAKRHWLMSVRALMRCAIPSMRKDDPTAGIRTKLPKSKGHHTWTDDEIEQYRACWPLGTQQRLVMEFALETASRRGEVVRLGPQHVKNGRIHIERTHGSKDVDIPISMELQAACDAMPKVHLTYVVTAYGKPRSKVGLGNAFADWATQAGLPARCRLHGLKKGGMRRLAEAGNTTHELMAISGHKTLTEVQRYTDDADRKRLAETGMAKRQAQTVNATLSNPAAQSVKPSAK
ncbi:MAG: tyrosine-type recombinase/integrase [Xanthobacteraceae bacterium]